MENRKIPCDQCGNVLAIPEPPVIIKKEPCKCGLNTEARVARWTAVGAIAFFMMAFGGCWIVHHYNTQQVKAVVENYELKKRQGVLGEPEYGVGPKDEK